MTVNVSSSRRGRAMEMDVAGAGMLTGGDEGRFNARQIGTRRQKAEADDYGIVAYTLTPTQQALIQTIRNGTQALRSLNADLAEPTQLPPLGTSIFI
jgi:hypothetical protein